MTSRTPSEPPDEPLNVAEPQILSPASPKPIHFPTPSNIPVLEMQMDVGFNQTELHMNDPAMRNTETRPNMWKDPNEQERETQQQDALQATNGLNEPNASPGLQNVKQEAAIEESMADSAVFANLAPFVNAQSQDQSGNASLTAYNGARDIQALLGNLGQPTPQPQSSAIPTIESKLHAPGVDPTPVSAQGFGAPPSGLPPRPPPQDQSRTQTTQQLSQSIHEYHSHPSLPSLQTLPLKDASTADQTYHSRAASILSPTSAKTSVSNTLQSPFVANFSPNPSDTAVESRRGNPYPTNPSNDRTWNPELQRKYDHFLDEERRYVNEGRWEQFPQGSRLFVGNLSSDKVTKKEVFVVFQRYGELAQISLKQAYGFVQYLHAEDCLRALQNEEGTQLGEKRIHLEVSKPQKNRNSQQTQRRSRSPDGGRGSRAGQDRFGGRSQQQSRGSRHDSYGPRSPSPPRGGYGDRRYDGYRSRSPERGYARNRGYRSPSPRRSNEDDLPLPRRAPHEIPDIQILVVDNLEREFVAWVERAFTARGLRSDALTLGPRLSEAAVIRRQIVEGVVAVCRLTRRNQDTAKIGLQIFDRSAGANNVKFEEYDNLDPSIAVELVLRAKQTKVTPSYGSGQYGAAPQQAHQHYPAHTSYPQPGPPQQQYQQAPTQNTAAPNIQNMINSLDTNSLQSLLSAMNQPQAQTPQQYGAAAPPPHQAAYSALQQNPQALAGLVQQQQQQAAQPNYGSMSSATGPAPSAGTAVPPGVNMQEILARLGTYKA